MLSKFLRRLTGATGKIASVTILSQVVSALSVLAVSRNGVQISDLYALGLQVGTGAFSGYVMGVVYLIAIGRPHFNSWTLHSAIGTFVSALICIATSLIYVRHGGNSAPSYYIAVFALFGVGGACLAVSGVRGVRQACQGSPLMLASNTIAPNAVMAITALILSYTHADAMVRSVAPAASWVTAALLSLAYSARSERSFTLKPANKPLVQDRLAVHSVSLAVGVISSTLMPIAYGTAISALKHGALTILFLSTRLGSAAVNVGVNSVLMAKYNWMETSKVSFRVPSFLMSGVLIFALIADFTPYFHPAYPDLSLIKYLPIIMAWLMSITSAPLLLRHVNALKLVYFVTAKVVIDLIVSSLSAVFLFGNPSISGFFSVFIISQCVTCIVCAFALRARYIFAASSASLLFILPTLIRGY